MEQRDSEANAVIVSDSVLPDRNFKLADATWPYVATRTSATSVRERVLAAWPRVVVGATFLLVTILASWNLAAYPSPWFDEGINLQAARNLALSGRYGLMYSGELRPFDVQMTTGPTVIGPVAVVFKQFGVGVLQGRLVMLAFVLLAALGMYLAARLLYGPTVAWITLLVLCATARAGPATTRDVVGEIAALAFLFWGIVAFAIARRSGRASLYAAAGLLFGLTVLTKAQFGLVLPALFVAWLLTRGQQGGFCARHLCLVLATAIAPLALWQLFQVSFFGLDAYVAHIRDQSTEVSISAVSVPLGKAYESVRHLFFSYLAPLGMIGLLYVWLAALSGGVRRMVAERLILQVFGLAWLAWFVGLSMGYDRYAVPLLAICSVFVAVFYRDLMASLRFETTAGSAVDMHPLRTAVALLLASPLAVGIALQLLAVGRPPEATTYEMAAIINQQVAPTAVTESYEWQLDVLSDRPFHHPPPFVPPKPYTMPPTDYLVDGPWSKMFELYDQELEQHNYHLIASVGLYDLYQRDEVAQARGAP